MEELKTLLSHPLVVGSFITAISVVLTAFVTYKFGIKRSRKKIRDDLYINFQSDNETFRRELIDEKNRAKELVVELEAKKDSLEETLQFYKNEYSGIVEKYQATQQLLTKIKVKYDALEVELRKIREELVNTQKERDEIKSKFEKVDHDYQEATREISKLKSIINNMKKRNDREDSDKKKKTAQTRSKKKK